jgi:hypothetical protein
VVINLVDLPRRYKGTIFGVVYDNTLIVYTVGDPTARYVFAKKLTIGDEFEIDAILSEFLLDVMFDAPLNKVTPYSWVD